MSLPCFFVPSRILRLSPSILLRSWYGSLYFGIRPWSDLRLGRLQCPWSAITPDMYVITVFYVKMNALPGASDAILHLTSFNSPLSIVCIACVGAKVAPLPPRILGVVALLWWLL